MAEVLLMSYLGNAFFLQKIVLHRYLFADSLFYTFLNEEKKTSLPSGMLQLLCIINDIHIFQDSYRSMF